MIMIHTKLIRVTIYKAYIISVNIIVITNQMLLSKRPTGVHKKAIIYFMMMSTSFVDEHIMI